MVVSVDGRSLDIRSVLSVAEGRQKVKLSAISVKRMTKFRSILEEKVSSGSAVYGVNTGIGSLSNRTIPVKLQRVGQTNLVRSHAAGVGHPMAKEVVRAAMLLRLNSLATGNSAIRPSVASALAELLNRDITPYVPRFGSLGASGDLVPSAHVAMTLIGEGKAYWRDQLVGSSKALASNGIKPVQLESKEGLSLINGTCFTTAFGAICVSRGLTLLEAANGAVALKIEAQGASMQSFDDQLMKLKADPGQAWVARRIRALVKGSRRVRDEPVPQDPYSIRCAPQVHGAVKDALDFAGATVLREANSVSDNPVFLEDGRVLHGGNFHAQPVAMALDLLSYSLSYLGVMSLSRISLLLERSSADRKYMAGNPGLESGLMILEYTASALAAENAKQSYPLSTYPANVSGGVENHASYGVNAGLKAMAVTENVSRILAIEVICSSNFIGSDLSGLSGRSVSSLRSLRAVSPLLKGDRSMGDEIEAVAKAILAGMLAPPEAA